MTYTYDTWGNITEKKIYAYTTATNPGTPTSTITYGYSTGSWKDQLVSYGNQTIAYDAMGNPTTYRGKALTWRGKQLTGIAVGTDMIAYSYDENGLRLQKTVNNVATDYYYNGKVLIGLAKGSDTLRFSYDAAGLAQAVNHNGTYYYYLRNGQGDIVKLIDGSGTTVVEYTYDSWGKQLSCTGTLATTLGALNPFRYRGYVYDEETGFYYLKSRYYDPEACRFISADVLLSTGQGVIGHNCYAYCGNNPISRTDSNGGCWEEFWEWFKSFFGSDNSSDVTSTPPTIPIVVPTAIPTPTSTPAARPTATPGPSKSELVIEAVIACYNSGAYNRIVYKYGGNDCSWFVKNIYIQAGYSLGVTKGSSEMFNQMVNDPDNWLTSEAIGISNWNLERGDIVFWEGPNRCECITKYHHSACARLWKIHHIGIYIGDNMILDNAPGTNVSIRSIYDVGTKIAGYARRTWD